MSGLEWARSRASEKGLFRWSVLLDSHEMTAGTSETIRSACKKAHEKVSEFLDSKELRRASRNYRIMIRRVENEKIRNKKHSS